MPMSSMQPVKESNSSLSIIHFGSRSCFQISMSPSRWTYCIRCIREFWSTWYHGWRIQMHSEQLKSMHAAILCHQIITSRSFQEESQLYLGFQAKSTKICAEFSLVLLLICRFLVNKYHHTWLELSMCSSTSYTSRSFHLIQEIPFNTLMTCLQFFTRTNPFLLTLVCESTSIFWNFIV